MRIDVSLYLNIFKSDRYAWEKKKYFSKTLLDDVDDRFVTSNYVIMHYVSGPRAEANKSFVWINRS